MEFITAMKRRYYASMVKRQAKKVGDGLRILGDVRIGEGAIIQAGSVVVSDIPSCGIAGGHPAKVFKFRDKEHYYKLKRMKQFH